MADEEENQAIAAFDRFYWLAAPVVAIIVVVAAGLASGSPAIAIPFLVLAGGVYSAIWMIVPRYLARRGKRN